MDSTVDEHGFRPNVGIALLQTPPTQAAASRVLGARRIGGYNAWQFPQGGIKEAETIEEALFRELSEEVGLCKDDVRILSQT